LGQLEEAKTLGGVGSILELIPGVSIVGYILTLFAVKKISDALNDKSIFDNMLLAVVTGIVAVVSLVFLAFTGAVFAVFTLGASLLFVFAGLAVAWVMFIVSSLYLRKSFDTMATRLNNNNFRTAGMLYFYGAILTIIFVGLILIFIAYIFQIIAFFAITETAQPGQHMGTAPGSTAMGTPELAAGMKFCPMCGSQMAVSAEFCPRCGAKQPV
jgi:uncharacterized membrane protein